MPGAGAAKVICLSVRFLPTERLDGPNCRAGRVPSSRTRRRSMLRALALAALPLAAGYAPVRPLPHSLVAHGRLRTPSRMAAEAREVDQSKILTAEELRKHPGWPLVYEAVQLSYKCGARAVFLYGSCKFDPVSANDVDLLVCGMTEQKRDELMYDRADDLPKPVDVVMFDTSATARFHVKHNLPRSYYVNRDGAVSPAMALIPELMGRAGGGGSGAGWWDKKDSTLADEMRQYLDRLNTTMARLNRSEVRLKWSLDDSNNLDPKDDNFVRRDAQISMGGMQIVDGWRVVEKVLKRICAVKGVELFKSGSGRRDMIREFHTNPKLKGLLPNQGQLTEEFFRKNRRSRDGELHRLQKWRKKYAYGEDDDGDGEAASIDAEFSLPMGMQAAQQPSCLREQEQAVKDFQVVYDAFAKATDDGKFDIVLLR